MRFRIVERLLLEWSEKQVNQFKDKFGEEQFSNFEKARDRLKKAGYSTDIQYYLSDKFDSKDLAPLLTSLYDSEKDAQRIKMVNNETRNVRGKYNFFGEFGGYLVYQPLDYISSMDLGINTGWCTTGRYRHGGHPDYTPSEEAAKKHFNDYTSKGVKLYYFLNPRTFYGEYAIALYPEILRPYEESYDKQTDSVIFVKGTNYELFDYMDNNVWAINDVVGIAKDNLGLNLVLNYEETDVKVQNGLKIKDDVLLKCYDKSSMKIKIPNGVKYIGGSAFAEFNNLTSVKIPDSVISIGYYAFYECERLTNVIIPNSVTSIGMSAFTHCKSLTSIVIPSSVKIIEDNAFADCTSLTSITIPNGIESIGRFTFEGCTNLSSITIPNSVLSIGEYAFSHCKKLSNIDIKYGLKKIDDYAFDSCSSIKNINIPDSVTSIGNEAFQNCYGLKTVIMSSNVINVKNRAFFNCMFLSNIMYSGNNQEVISELSKYANVVNPETKEIIAEKQ